MKNLNRFFYFFIFLFAHVVQAQNFTASINRNPIAAGEQFVLTYSLNMTGTNFRVPALQDFSVLSGPNQSMSTQFINGKVSQSITYTYYLMAAKEGRYVIPPATIESGGKLMNSNSITVEVVKGNSKPSNPGNQQNSSGSSEQLSQNVFIKATVSKANPSVGEAIYVTYKLYTRVALVSYSLSKIPSLNGFWSQELEMNKQLQFTQTTLDGVAYQVADLKKMILFPQRSGSLEIDRMEGECIARIQVKRQRSNDPWDNFFNDPFFGMGQQDVKQPLKSESIRIQVKELQGNAPEGFSGAVGNFTMEAYIDKPETKTNEPVLLKIKISGSGNLKLIDAPKPILPSDIESYDPKTSDNISVTANGVSGSRTFEYLLVPRHAGQFKIPSFDFSYFSLEKKAYQSIPSREFILKVSQGTDAEGSVPLGVNKEEVQLLGKDVRYIKTETPEFYSSKDSFFYSLSFVGLIGSPLVLFGLFLFAYRRNEALRSNLVLMRSRSANKIAKKRLAMAQKNLQEGARQNFYDEIFKALYGYLSDRLEISVSELSKQSIQLDLAKRNISSDQILKVIGTLDKCEFSRFSPNAEGEMNSMYEDTIQLITSLEEKLK